MSRFSRCSIAAIFVLVALGLMWFFAHDVQAKKRAAKKPPAVKTITKTVTSTTTAKGTTTVTETTTIVHAENETPAAAKPADVKKAKSYSFGGLDIDGKLRTPQLLYFLNRMKSEFDATAPAHRSFIPELENSPSEM